MAVQHGTGTDTAILGNVSNSRKMVSLAVFQLKAAYEIMSRMILINVTHKAVEENMMVIISFLLQPVQFRIWRSAAATLLIRETNGE